MQTKQVFTASVRLACAALAIRSLAACDERPLEGARLDRIAEAQTLSALVPAVNADLEGPDTQIQSTGSSWKLVDDQKNLYFNLAGSMGTTAPYFATDKPYISSSLSFRDTHSLQLTLPPRSGTTGPDTVELRANRPGDETRYGVGFNFDNPKYFGFAMYLHGSSGRQALATQIMRAVQLGSGPAGSTSKCGVPFSVTLWADVFLDFAVGSNSGQTVIHQAGITKDAWHTFVFFLQPNSIEMPGKGVVTIWIDGIMVKDWHGDWGCNITGPDANNGTYGTIVDEWELRVGLHRWPNGAASQWHYVFFDNIRVAPSFAQANPDG